MGAAGVQKLEGTMTGAELGSILWEKRQLVVTIDENPYHKTAPHMDAYRTFERALESGRDYLYGERVTMDEMRRRKSAIADWMRPIVQYAFEHPEHEVRFSIPQRVRSMTGEWEYTILRRGEYVEIGLPHQDSGGERHWITRDGKYKHLVNVD